MPERELRAPGACAIACLLLTGHTCHARGGQCQDLVPENRQPGTPCGGPDVGECSSSGTCACTEPYAGADCSQCERGYSYRVEEPAWGAGRFRCSPTPQPAVVTRNDNSSTSSSDSDALSRGVWGGIIACGAAIALALLALIVWQMRRRRQAAHAPAKALPSARRSSDEGPYAYSSAGMPQSAQTMLVRTNPMSQEHHSWGYTSMRSVYSSDDLPQGKGAVKHEAALPV